MEGEMKKSAILVNILILSASVMVVGKAEKVATIKAPVVRVALFKNGLVLVTREVNVPRGMEKVVVDGAPAPVHGTFWLEGDTDVRIAATTRTRKEVTTDAKKRLDWLEVFGQLKGKKLRLILGEDHVIAGEVCGFDAASDRWVMMKTSRGLEMVEPGRIQRVVVEDEAFVLKPETRRAEKEVRETRLEFTLAKATQTRKLVFSYLARGAAWVPAYRLNLADSGPAGLQFSTVVKNELADWKGTRLFLVSGFPALLYERVTSPMAPDQSLEQFFSLLSGGGGDSYARSRSVMAQAVVNVADMAGGGGAPDFSGTDTDFHVRDAGMVSLAKGDSLWLPLGTTSAEVTKTVEWEIPDFRDERGRPLHQRIQPDLNEMDPVWDTYTFNNPFAFPMTTAPLAVYREGQVLSQNLCRWTPPGHEARVRATRALNMHVTHEENEVEGSREVVHISGNDHRRLRLRGEFTVENRRPLVQTLVVRRTLWGKLITAEGDPQKSLLSTGARSVNPRTRLEWRFELKAGEERTLKYEVEVLVDI